MIDNSANEKRLNKYISESGFCSRRGADKLIEANRVTINGKIPELGTKVQPGDVVKVRLLPRVPKINRIVFILLITNPSV